MSARVPPDDPRQDPTRELDRESLRRLLLREYEALKSPEYIYPTEATPAQSPVIVNPPSGISGWITTALQSVTLAMLLAAMFWLGTLSNTVTNTSQKVDKLNDGIVGISKESLSNRMIVIETKLDAIDKKMESVQPSRLQSKERQ